jgi:hypothetical protein
MNDDDGWNDLFHRYKSLYYGETCQWFAGDFVEPADVFDLKNGCDVLVFQKPDGSWVTTTVGFGFVPPEESAAPIELVALSSEPSVAIAQELAGLAVAFGQDDPPLEPFHKLRYDDEKDGFFLLDGGPQSFGPSLPSLVVVQRLLVVPVSETEYGRAEMRGEVPGGDVPNVLPILDLGTDVSARNTLPNALLDRWANHVSQAG